MILDIDEAFRIDMHGRKIREYFENSSGNTKICKIINLKGKNANYSESLFNIFPCQLFSYQNNGESIHG